MRYVRECLAEGTAVPVRVYQATALFGAVVCALPAVETPDAFAATYAKISGLRSTWSANAVEQWRHNVRRQGMPRISPPASRSSSGRRARWGRPRSPWPPTPETWIAGVPVPAALGLVVSGASDSPTPREPRGT
ncbi:hypothetical protein ACFWFF_24420 [Streptomyces sp. NPDC060223]|uniref:hypothetical protein n=1 Tax=unclassified Streptomyces TaxID=2593676 RepID=UPI003637BB3D